MGEYNKFCFNDVVCRKDRAYCCQGLKWDLAQNKCISMWVFNSISSKIENDIIFPSQYLILKSI